MEQPGSPFCPVTSFTTYLSKLHPDCDRLWQYPRDSYCDLDTVWYANKPIGKNTLCSFMSTLSKRCNLSETYTNHCIRATGATILTRSKFASAQIMSVTGHKSVSSLAVYQRVSNIEKLQMSHALSRGMQPITVPGRPIQATSTRPRSMAAPIASTSRESSKDASADQTGMELFEGIDINDLLADFGQPTSQQAIEVTHQASIFERCNIQNVNIIVKK